MVSTVNRDVRSTSVAICVSSDGWGQTPFVTIDL